MSAPLRYLSCKMKIEAVDTRNTVEGGAARDVALKLFVVLSRSHAAVSAHLHAHVAEHGLTLTEFGILEVLYHKGPLLLGEVQKRILVSSGGVTYLVDRLEAKGLAASSRVRPAGGGSRRVFEVTRAGARALAETRAMGERRKAATLNV